MWLHRIAFAAILHIVGSSSSTSTVCSPSCLAHEDIISCRRFDHADILSCYRQHKSATVLDLSYIAIAEPLTEASFSGLDGITVLYLDGTRFRSPVDIATLSTLPRLRMVYLRRMPSTIDDLIAAVVASASVREVGLADNFVVCSCDWVATVVALTANDVAIVDWEDTAPRCAPDTIETCTSGRNSTSSVNAKPISRPAAVGSLVEVFMNQLASLDVSKTMSHYRRHRARRDRRKEMKKRRDADDDESGSNEKTNTDDDDKVVVDFEVDRSSAKRHSNVDDDDDENHMKQSVVQQKARLLRGKKSQLEANEKMEDETNVVEFNKHERELMERSQNREDNQAAEKDATRRDKTAAAAAAAADDDVDDRDVMEKREEADEKSMDAMGDLRLSHRKRDYDDDDKPPKKRPSRMSDHRWIAHPGTISLIVSLSVLFVLMCVYFLTPCKTAVDKLLPSAPVIGGGSAKKKSTNWSRSNSSFNASPNAAPSSDTIEGMMSSEDVAKETTPLVSSAVSDVSTKQIEDEKTKDKKDKKEKKWKSILSKSSDKNVNENNGGRWYQRQPDSDESSMSRSQHDHWLEDEETVE